MAEWKVKPNCLFKDIITSAGGKLKRDFSYKISASFRWLSVMYLPKAGIWHDMKA
jgi:hypothetical protein